MNKIPSIIILLLFIFIERSLYSQTGLDISLKDDPSNKVNASDLTFSKDFIQTPSAASLNDAGSANVDLFTGRATYSIPLYTFKSHDLSLPISINYSSAGVTVDKLADWTGMDWNLNAGGSITREIRGLPDETPTNGYFARGSSLNNFYTDLKNSNDNLMSYQDKCNWVDAASKNTIDLEPDIYYFNFGGYSGKFIIDYNQNIHIMPSQFLNIAPIKHTGNIIDGFVITTPDGIKYSFGINTDAIEETHILSASYQTHRDNLDLNDYETSNLENIITKEIPYYRSGWHLSKIESPASDEIDLSYKANDIAYVTPQRTTLYYCPGASTYYYNGQTSKRDGYLYRYIFQLISQVDTTFIPPYTYGGVPDTQERVQAMSSTKAYIYTFSQSRYEIKQKKLLKITGKCGNYIDFISDNNRPDLTNGLELTGINIYGFSNNLIKSYILNYTNVSSVSYAHACKNPMSIGEYYYFSKNTDAISQGAMPPSEIMSHVPNSPYYASLGSYVGEGFKPYNYNRLFLQSIVETNGTQAKPPFEFTYITPEQLQRRTSLWVDYFGYNKNDSVEEYVPLSTINHVYFITGLDNVDEIDANIKPRQVPVNVSQAGLLNKITTPLGGEIDFMFEDNQFYTVKDIGWTCKKPGCRVAKLVKKENTVSSSIITKYKYSDEKNWYYEPVYKQYRPFYQEYTNSQLTTNNLVYIAHKTQVLSSANLGNTITTNGSMVGYNKVEVSASNLTEDFSPGKEVFTFSTDNDPDSKLFVTPVLSLKTWKNNRLKSDNIYRLDATHGYFFDRIPYPVFDISFKRGMLLNHLVLDNNGIRIKSTSNSYSISSGDTVFAFYTNNFSFVKTGSDIAMRREACIYGHPSQYIVLSSVIDTVFEQNNPKKYLILRKDFTYNGLNGLPASEKYMQSDGLVHETRYKYYMENMYKNTTYTYDLTDPFTKAILAMENKNIQSALIEKTEYVDGKVINGTLIEYGAFPTLNKDCNALPARTWQLNLSKPLDGSGYLQAYFNTQLVNGVYRKVFIPNSNFKLETIADAYDSCSNPLQMHRANGQITSVIWGYNKTLPVIKAENITNTDLATAISYLTTNGLEKLISDVGDMTTDGQKNLWKTFNNQLRNNLPGNAVITTYTYKPLVGTTSSSGPDGVTIYYEYDILGRLKLVRDKDGKILKQNRYHYQYQQ